MLRSAAGASGHRSAAAQAATTRCVASSPDSLQARQAARPACLSVSVLFLCGHGVESPEKHVSSLGADAAAAGQLKHGGLAGFLAERAPGSGRVGTQQAAQVAGSKMLEGQEGARQLGGKAVTQHPAEPQLQGRVPRQRVGDTSIWHRCCAHVAGWAASRDPAAPSLASDLCRQGKPVV